jgi:hypothetical protein
MDLETTQEIPKDELDELLDRMRGATAVDGTGTPEDVVALRNLVQETKVLVQQLIDAGKDTSRRSPQTMREDLEYGPGAWLSPVERELRKSLGYCYSAGHIYGDDGEFHDSRMPYPIDYMRDSVDTIRTQIQNRGQYQINTFKQIKNLLEDIVNHKSDKYCCELYAGARELADEILTRWMK